MVMVPCILTLKKTSPLLWEMTSTKHQKTLDHGFCHSHSHYNTTCDANFWVEKCIFLSFDEV